MAIYEGINFHSIKLDAKVLAKDHYHLNSEDQKVFSKLAKVNFFVGPNNSGKSRFLRGLFASSTFEASFEGIDLSPLVSTKDKFIQTVLDRVTQQVSHDQSAFRTLLQNYVHAFGSVEVKHREKLITRYDFGFLHGLIDDLSSGRATISNRDHNLSRIFSNSVWVDSAVRIILEEYDILISNVKAIIEGLPKINNFSKKNIYIPILRSLRKLGVDNDILLDITHAEYFPWLSDSNNFGRVSELLEIFNGTRTYDYLTTQLLNSSETRKVVQEYEEFLQEQFFQGKEVQISPTYGENVVKIKIDNQEKKFYDLGDGMQSIIMLTLPAFFEQQNCMIFVEEPEIYLHPGLQRRFIEVVLTNERLKRHQWFFTTHSNHMLDLTLDYKYMSVFHFEYKEETKKFEIMQMTSPDHNILKSLGVMGSSVFRTNALIWVDGVTDRRYIREFLKKRLRQLNLEHTFEEDIHYTFVEYNGGNVVHFDFSEDDHETDINVQKICDKSFVVLDGDNQKRKNYLDKLKENLGENLFCFDCKEIENSLPEEVVRVVTQVFIENANILSNESECKKKIVEIKYDEYFESSKGLGDYLDTKLQVVVERETNKDRFFQPLNVNSGTLHRKTEFCEKFIETVEEPSFSWKLSPELIKLTDAIIHFIKKSN